MSRPYILIDGVERQMNDEEYALYQADVTRSLVTQRSAAADNSTAEFTRRKAQALAASGDVWGALQLLNKVK